MQFKTCVVLGSLAIAGVGGVVSVTTATAAPASAEEWCGFHDKPGSRVRCGYSSAAECKDNVVGKDAVCMPSPYFAMWTAPKKTVAG